MLKRTWRSPVYVFFKPEVIVQYCKGRLCHFFQCAAHKCKIASGGVCCYQDSKDKSSTANLKYHATRCFGDDAVALAIKGEIISSQSGSIFTVFARQGQKPVNYTHRVHTNPEVRYVILYLV